MARRPLRAFLLLLLGAVLAALGWTEYLIRREVVSPLAVWNPEGRPTALVVYHPGITAFPGAVAEGLATGLVEAGWRVESTSASSEAPTGVDGYALLAVVGPTYWWTPARPLLRYVRRLPDLHDKPTVAVVTGAGSTERSQRILVAALRDHHAAIVREMSLWTMKPNKEDEYSWRTNEDVGVRLAREAGRAIAPPDSATTP